MPLPARRSAFCLLLAAACAWSQSRLWDANLIDPGGMLPTGFSGPPDTSLIPSPSGDFHAAFTSDAAWRGVAKRAGGTRSRFEIASARTAQALWVSPLPQAALALLWTGTLARNRYVDPLRIDVRVGEERSALGMAWVQHVLAGPESHLDAGVLIPDRDRQGYAWMLSAGRGPWDAEYGVIRNESGEDVAVLNLDTAGNGEKVNGVIKTMTMTHRLLLKAPLAGGRISLLGAFAWTRPSRPVDQEFWFCDSSREADAYLAYTRPWLGWDWRARADFRESEAFTIGRRIPPGSEGLKRFHFARNHAEAWGMGAEAARSLGWQGWRLGAGYRRLDWGSAPPPDAFDSRRETLSYNRLGLSFIANLYGGLYKVSELIDAQASHEVWEARGEWDGRLGPLELGTGLSGYYAGFSAAAHGRTLDQRFIALDTTEHFREQLTGYALGVAPRFRATLSWRRCALAVEAAQTLPLLARVHGLEPEPSAPGPGPGGATPAESRPLGRNGFAARAGLRVGF